MAVPTFSDNPVLQEDLVAFWEYTQERKSENTTRIYTEGAKRFLNWLDDQGSSFEEMHQGALDNWLTHCLDNGLSVTTVKAYVSGIRAYVRYKERQGITVPKLHAPEYPKEDKNQIRVLGHEELKAYFYLAAERPDPVKTMLLLFPMTGLRCSEMVTLKTTQLEVRGPWIILNILGKGRKRREVPVLQQGNRIIREYLVNWYSAWGENPDGWMFPGKGGGGRRRTYMRQRTVRYHMENIGETIGVKKLGAHMIRKSYLTLLDKAGMSPFQVAQIAGHSSVRTTADHYIHHDFATLVDGMKDVNIEV